MLPEHVRLVRETWPMLEREADEAARIFYERLFTLDASAQALFAGVEMRQQGVKFMMMLGAIVDALDEAPQLVSSLAALGRRHVRYGVSGEHYESVGAALLWTIERVLGSAHTPDIREAWSEAYALLAAVLRRASATASGAAGATGPAEGATH